jgi:hypothetical protein
MDPTHGKDFAFGAGATESVLHPAVAVAMIVAALLMLLLPRKYVVLPFLFCIFLTPRDQQLVVAGFHIFVMRILILTGWARLMWWKFIQGKSLFSARWNSVDNAFLWWAICRATAFVLLYHEPAAVSNQVGFLWDALGGFFLLRYLIHDQADIRRVIQAFAVLAILLGAAMLNEKVHNQNIFGILGGGSPLVPETRNGSIRAQATFAHALCAGTFGATLLPLFLWLWDAGKSKILAALGMAAAIVMAVASSTSTAVMAAGGAVVGLCFWPLRTRMRWVRWGIVFGLLALNVVMKAPVWFVIGHIDITGSSSSFERAYLIDTFLRNFKDWWLVGTSNYASWGFDMWDLCNQYVAEGETGGLLTFIFFIAIISRSFARIGKARKLAKGNRKREWSLWLLGVALFSHVVGFFGISYFDQTRIAWYALLAIISAATAEALKVKTEIREVLPEITAEPALAEAMQ